MRAYEPRLPPLSDGELSDEQEALLAPFRTSGGDFAVARTFLRHPRALRAFNTLALHVFSSPDNALVPRDKEILILRTAWHCRSGYEWARHAVIGRRVGVTEAELAALKRPIEEGGWNARDAALVATADALNASHFVPDDVWDALTAHFEEQQCIDAIMAVGLYTLVAMFLNTTGIALDDDVTLDPDLDFRT